MQSVGDAFLVQLNTYTGSASSNNTPQQTMRCCAQKRGKICFAFDSFLVFLAFFPPLSVPDSTHINGEEAATAKGKQKKKQKTQPFSPVDTPHHPSRSLIYFVTGAHDGRFDEFISMARRRHGNTTNGARPDPTALWKKVLCGRVLCWKGYEISIFQARWMRLEHNREKKA